LQPTADLIERIVDVPHRLGIRQFNRRCLLAARVQEDFLQRSDAVVELLQQLLQRRGVVPRPLEEKRNGHRYLVLPADCEAHVHVI
jgi:hypothetical protein